MPLTLLPLVIAHWLHVLFAITWFGGVVYRNLIILPILVQASNEEQRQLARRFKERADQLILPIALLVIGLGILRGTIFGQIQTVDALLTPYGITWTAALVLALLIFGWDVFGVGAEVENWYSEQVDDEGTPLAAPAVAVALKQSASRILALGYIEIGGFILVFTCMILMRFGY